jgi:hypothetical protein
MAMMVVCDRCGVSVEPDEAVLAEFTRPSESDQVIAWGIRLDLCMDCASQLVALGAKDLIGEDAP